MSQIAIDIVNYGATPRESEFFAKVPENVQGKVFYYCVKHDYVFMPEQFTDTGNVRRRGGYYDETGQYYENLRIIDEDADGIITCEYCGKDIKLNDNSDILITLKCPHCDAGLEYLKEEKTKTVSKKVDLAEIERPVEKEEAIYKDRFRSSIEDAPRREKKSGKSDDFINNPVGGMFFLLLFSALVFAGVCFLMGCGSSLVNSIINTIKNL